MLVLISVNDIVKFNLNWGCILFVMYSVMDICMYDISHISYYADHYGFINYKGVIMNKMFFMLAVLLIGVPLTAAAHSDEYLDSHPSMSLHGGQTHMAGPYHIEIVAAEKDITVYMTDHAGNPIDVEIAHGSATIMNADETRTVIKLTAAGDNFLNGNGEFTLTETTEVWVSVKFPDEAAWRSKFTPLAKRQVAADDPSVSKSPVEHDHSAHQH